LTLLPKSSRTLLAFTTFYFQRTGM
jgi:hypothetical protein